MEEQNSLNQDFRLGSLMKYVFPSIFTFFFLSLYQIVDGVFIGQFVGELAVSAVNLYLPVISIFISVGIMLGTGGNAEIVKLVGQGRGKEAGETFSMLVIFSAAIGLIGTVLCLVFANPIMRFCGATDGTIEYLRPYYMTLSIFMLPILMQSELGILIIGEGKTVVTAVVIMVGGVLNCVLDYLFMKVFGMGIEGAAIATVIGYMSTIVYAVWFYIIKKKSSYRLEWPKFSFRVIGKICFNGSSDMITNLAAGVTALFMNHLVLRIYGDSGISALTVVSYIRMLIMSVFMGLTAAVEPVISYHYGSGNYDMRRRVFRLTSYWILILGALCTIAVWVLRGNIIGLFFTRGSEFFRIAETGILLSLPAVIVVGLNIFASGLFTAYSNGLISGLLSFLRTFVILTVCLFGLSALFGGTGLWIAWPVAEALTLVVSYFTIYKFRGRYNF